MPYRLLLAGAAGVIGRRLVPLLVEAGHDVFGTTRSADRAQALQAAGVTPVTVDVYDATALSRAVGSIRPEIVIHQLTDIPRNLDPSRAGEASARNARIRREGTPNLVAAATAAGARRMIAQSIAWMYAPGREPHDESDPLDLQAEGTRGVSVGGVAALEDATLNAAPLEGIVLRYGQFYGPGTGVDQAKGSAPLHVDAAAWACVIAIDKARPGIYNVAEPNSYVSTEKAVRELGWDPAYRLAKSGLEST
jgi:nucleoside-diphosphate-sugar epimerase